MTKPEWFEITENDAPGKEFKSARKLPLLVLLSSILVVGVGAIAAQNQAGQTVFTDEVIASASASAQAAPVLQANTQPATSTSNIKASTPTATLAAPKAPTANPSIAMMPTGGGDDDDEDDDDEDDDGHDRDGDRDHGGEEDDD
jgi:hypothetical protein